MRISITEEFQKGYMYRDSVVRHSMEVLFSQRQKVVLTLAIRSVIVLYFVQLRIAKVKTTFCLCENSTSILCLTTESRYI